MAKSQFLENVSTARNLFFHRVRTDDPSHDPETVEEQLHRDALWLTPSTVRGFREQEFQELPTEERRKLKENVEGFVAIAKTLSPMETPEREPLQRAMRHFQEIARILEPYFHPTDEAELVRQTLEDITFPSWLVTWHFEIGEDSTGDPALWIWYFVDSEIIEREDFFDLGSEVRRRIRDALSKAGVKRWPYIYVRTALEQRAL